MIERWEKIVGLPKTHTGIFMVSNFGRVKRLTNRVTCSLGRERNYGEKVLKQSTDYYGYKIINLKSRGRTVTKKVHRLIADAFVPGKTYQRNVVNHRDHDRGNNSLENLEWVSILENNIHSVLKNRRYKASQVQEMDMLRLSGKTYQEIAEKFGTDPGNAKNIVSRHIYKDVPKRTSII